METDVSYQVLGLAGQQGAGKDHTYEALVALYEGKRRVRRMAFADGVRREVTLDVLKAVWPDVTFKDTDGAGTWAKPYTAGQRFILQRWGTEFRRAQDPDYWVKYGLGYIEEHAEDGDLWVVTDVRVENETAALRDLPNGSTALVMATLEERAGRLGLTEADLAKRSQHASEVIDFSPEYVVMNHADVVLEPNLLAWLGLDPKCLRCGFAQGHIFHDNGVTFNG